MVLRMKNVNILGGSLKNPTFRGEGGSQKTNVEGIAWKGGAWTVCRFKGRLGKKEGVVFRERVDTPMDAMSYPKIVWLMS